VRALRRVGGVVADCGLADRLQQSARMRSKQCSSDTGALNLLSFELRFVIVRIRDCECPRESIGQQEAHLQTR
jgi:hypothetical protein